MAKETFLSVVPGANNAIRKPRAAIVSLPLISTLSPALSGSFQYSTLLKQPWPTASPPGAVLSIWLFSDTFVPGLIVGARAIERPPLAIAAPAALIQFERTGYFCVDTRDSTPARPVFNRAVGLRDTWGKIEKAAG